MRLCGAQWKSAPSSQKRIRSRSEAWGQAGLVRTMQRLLTGVDIFPVPFQGVRAFQPLPTAVDLAHKPGIPSASLLVLLKTRRQVARGQKTWWRHTYTLAHCKGFCHSCVLGHPSCRGMEGISCIVMSVRKTHLNPSVYLVQCWLTPSTNCALKNDLQTSESHFVARH